MNRLAMMVLKNALHVPALWWKLCHYAAHTDEYPEKEKWDHIHLIMQRAIAKQGFQRSGIIHLANGSPRIAYDLLVG